MLKSSNISTAPSSDVVKLPFIQTQDGATLFYKDWGHRSTCSIYPRMGRRGRYVGIPFTMPTLIIHGDHDQSHPIDLTGRRNAQAISGSQLKVYEGAAHGLFITHKDRLNRDLLAFIQD